MSDRVIVTVDGGIADVRFNRPDKRNALDREQFAAIAEVGERLKTESGVRVVVLSGEGESFCAGLDFATVLQDPPRVARSFVPLPWRGTNLFQEACWAWRRLPVPVVAAVHGHCYGGGLQIALAADLRMTTADARWSVLEARWGLVPDMSGVHALKQQVGIDVAKRLTMTGEVVDGTRAVGLGLASEVQADPVGAAEAFLEEVATRSPDSVAATKRLFERTWTSGARRTFARERLEQARLLASRNTRVAREAAMRRATPEFGPRAR